MTSPVRAPRPTPRRVPGAAPARTAGPELRVVRDAERLPRPGRSGMAIAAAGVVVFAALLASAVFHSMLVSGQAHLDEVEGRIRTERSTLQREELRLADYQSPERIAREAARLGMIPAERQHWVSPEGDAPMVVDTEAGGPGVTSVDDLTDTRDPDAGGTDTNTDSTTNGDSDGSELASGDQGGSTTP
jgi:hypothetical protein